MTVSFQLLAIADLDKNGLIDYNEFQAMMTADEESGDCRQQWYTLSLHK